MSHHLYVNMKFPEPGPGTEYPKWVIGDGTRPDHKLANNADEEAAILASEESIDPEARKAALLEEAEARGIEVDKRWGADRIAKALADAE